MIPSGALAPRFAALFEPGWVDAMRDSITRGQTSPEGLILTAALFAAFGLFIALGLLVKIRFRKEEKPPPIAWITKASAIRDILGKALTERSKVRISFAREDPGAKSTDAVLESMTADRLVFELSSIQTVNAAWIGKSIDADFRLRPDPGRENQVFYSFMTEIVDLRRGQDGFTRMSASLPSRLEMEQKRAFLRIEPQRSLIRVLTLWHEDHIRSAKGRFDDPSTWGDPIFELTPENAPCVLVADISGGGMRLEAQKNELRCSRHMLEAGQRLFLRLGLFDADSAAVETFLLGVKVQNVYVEGELPGALPFGLRFMGQGIRKEPDKPFVSWLPCGAAGIQGIDDWVFKRHLEIYRGRG